MSLLCLNGKCAIFSRFLQQHIEMIKQTKNILAHELTSCQTGQIIYLDESPPKLRALLLRGGHLVFDDNQDLILKSDYILILGGGSVTVRRKLFDIFFELIDSVCIISDERC